MHITSTVRTSEVRALCISASSSSSSSAESQLDQLKETKQWFDDHSSFYVELHAFCKDHTHVHFFECIYVDDKEQANLNFFFFFFR